MKLFKSTREVPALVAPSPRAPLVHRDPAGDGWLVTASTLTPRKGPLKWRPPRSLQGAVPYTTDPSRWDDARGRVHFGFASKVNPPVPPDVLDEATLWLYAHPSRRLEYMGRGRYLNKERLPTTVDKLLYFDVAGGQRSYTFRIMDLASDGLDPRAAAVRESLMSKAQWADDPEARVVLSLGGGGYRLFAAQAALKVLEHAFGGDRSKVHEVWGSSGGSLLGYVFANGLDLSVVDELGYCLYHGREVQVPGLHLSSLVPVAARLVKDLATGQVGAPELTAWVEAIDRMCPPERRGPHRIPFYTMVSSVRRSRPVAFSEPEYISDSCRDIVLPCSVREATAASMSIPFLMRPLRGVRGFEDDSWFDGSIVDENPVMLPFVKWLRDREADPEGTPKRLKIILVNLNMRLSESRLVSGISKSNIPVLSSVVRRSSELADLLLDSKTYSLIRTLCELDDVEVLTSTLSMGRLNFIARRDIPAAIRCGQVVEGWRYELFRKTSRGAAT